MTVVRAAMTFTVDTGERPVSASAVAGGRVEYTGSFERREVAIADARAIAGELDLDRHGFVLARLDVDLAGLVGDPAALRRDYDPRITRLIAGLTGAAEVLIFDHTVRSGDPAAQAAGRREPVQVVHNDYTERSAPRRVRDLLGDRAEALLRRRFAVVQTWQPIRPVLSSPLALCDARSLSASHLIACERRHPDRVGETYHIAFDPAQRWYWFPRAQPDEVIVFKTFDSDGARARFTAHGSFTDPGAPAGAPPRESVEVRSFAFF